MPNILRLAALLFVAALVVLLLGPGTPLEREIIGLDKLAHFGAFGGLLWSFGVLFRRQPRALLAIYAIGFGALAEVVQGLVGRDASWLDLLADALGVLVALAVWSWWRGFKPRGRLAAKLRHAEASREPQPDLQTNAAPPLERGAASSEI